MIGRCPKCGKTLYDNGKFYGCEHRDKYDMEERAAIREFDGGEKRERAERKAVEYSSN
jgi:ssDNA-binding Zn-finger/Zn-ribbon topoisomerase 1